MRYFFILIFLFPVFLFAQKHDYNWRVGYGESTIYSEGNVQLSFDDNASIGIDRVGMSHIKFSDVSSISNEGGELLFSFNGVYIEDSSYQILDTLGDYNGLGNEIPQNNIILPIPNRPNKYMIIHSDAEQLPTIGTRMTDVYYSILDMTLNNGKVTSKKISLITDTLSYGQITATKHANGRDWWILVSRWNSNKYYTLLLSPNGIEMHHL